MPIQKVAIVLREGSGVDLIDAIREAPRALVFISVPWSNPERLARRVFYAAVAKLDQRHPELGIAAFRLEVDEDVIAKDWLASIGYSEFADYGSGSLLWLQSGQVIYSQITANSLSRDSIVACSVLLW